MLIKRIRRKIYNKYRNVRFSHKYKKQLSGHGVVNSNKNDFFNIDRTSMLILKGDLDMSSLSFGNNHRSSLLRMDEKSILECNGFHFMYGADIQLFKNSHLVLGKGSFINSDCKIRCHKEITIGEGCAISHDFTVMDSNSHELDGSRNTKPVHIGNHVWIGTRVTVLSGVTVGGGAVIAAGSLVTKNVPEDSLVGGVPARILKEKVEWKF